MRIADLSRSDALLMSAGIYLIEVDLPAIEFEIATANGRVSIISDLYIIDEVLVFDRVHVTGEGLTISMIRRLAKVLGEVENVGEVLIQGGDRSSGANRGSSPTPIRVRVKS